MRQVVIVQNWCSAADCQNDDGGVHNSRILTEGQYVLIEKGDGRWPTWAMQAMGEVEAEVIRQARWSVYFDALSDHTEGTP